MSGALTPTCAKCPFEEKERACRRKGGKAPAFCPTKRMEAEIEKAAEAYLKPETFEFARQASIQEASCYINRDQKPFVRHPVKPRLQEISEFAARMGYKRLGLAFCAGLFKEASVFSAYLERCGFEVVSVVCKVGCTSKEHIGITAAEKVCVGEQPEAMCSPIAQAIILNESKTDFNILLGLCVGHDSLFFKHASAPTTVFAVKDLVTGHNPLAAIYTIDSYYERFKK